MATRTSSLLHNDPGTDANFRAVAQFIEDTLVTTGGWVVTTDTGQTLPSALVHPTVAGSVGYRVYRMDDALQATVPVFMRLDFGKSGLGPWAMWVMIGMGSDGAGNITNKLMSAQQIVGAGSNSFDASTLTNSYGSADKNRVTLGLFVQAAHLDYPVVFSLERTKDATGADTGDGLLMICNATGGFTMEHSRYMIYALVQQPIPELGLSYILTQNNPTQSFGDIGVGVISPFKGIVQQPGMNVVVVNSLDMSPEATFSLTIYGASHTYQHMNSLSACKCLSGNTAVGSANDAARVCIRFE